MFSDVFYFGYCAVFSLRNDEGIYLFLNEITGRKTVIREMSEGINYKEVSEYEK